ncbi:hypothetical protein T11_4793 [Trichinella zimbabwensis]|uniref:Uncharacterized protein n=1 Tax=Trichinella zimbabwensis TaxID=268475 RepID=A0A0V1HUI2_9BILA|nr:hypothetical protein T11_4793 [Trichinella zimbabwensis]
MKVVSLAFGFPRRGCSFLFPLEHWTRTNKQQQQQQQQQTSAKLISSLDFRLTLLDDASSRTGASTFLSFSDNFVPVQRRPSDRWDSLQCEGFFARAVRKHLLKYSILCKHQPEKWKIFKKKKARTKTFTIANCVATSSQRLINTVHTCAMKNLENFFDWQSATSGNYPHLNHYQFHLHSQIKNLNFIAAKKFTAINYIQCASSYEIYGLKH